MNSNRNSNNHGTFEVVVQAKRIHDQIEHRTTSFDVHYTNNYNSSNIPSVSTSTSSSKSGSISASIKNRKKPSTKTNRNDNNNNQLIVSKAGASTTAVVKHKKKSKAKKKSLNKEDLKSPYDTDVHMLNIDKLESMFHTDIETGLDLEYYTHLLDMHGENKLTPIQKESNLVKLLRHVFTGVFNILLWVASIVQLAMYFILTDENNGHNKLDIIVPIIMIIVITTAGVFEYYQELKSERIMESFDQFNAGNVYVIRNDKQLCVNTTSLVPGDIILFNAGDKVPADIRIIESSNDLIVDNSSLTGESEPLIKNNKFTNKNCMETNNIIFFGTLVLKGKGKGIVYKTGDNTLLGQIHQLSSIKTHGKSTFQEEMSNFVTLISFVAILIGIICIIFDVIKGEPIKKIIYFGICIIMANIPEGLLPTVTLAMTLSAKKMSKKNVLVRNLDCIETLGCVNVICSDKTGTITRGKMTLSHVCLSENNILKEYKARYFSDIFFKNNYNNTYLLFRTAILCSSVTFNHTTEDEYDLNGTPTELAIMRGCLNIFNHNHKNVIEFKNMFPVKYEIPFNSELKYQISIHKLIQNNEYLLVIKGAPEIILKNCNNYCDENGNNIKLTSEHKATILDRIKDACNFGERCLCFAYSTFKINNDDNSEYVFDGNSLDTLNIKFELNYIGFMSLIDPPRKEVKKAIEMCHTAGIRVVMVTGDHQLTAVAIAKQVGIIQDDNYNNGNNEINGVINDTYALNMYKDYRVVSGDELNNSELVNSKEYWDNLIYGYKSLVFARLSPIHKMIIVEEFQKRNMIVAVTGDGVNDAPALNQANIGISMGKNGTDVARETSDIILMDDNFKSIVSGIEQGRLILENLKKSIAYTLCSKTPQLMPIILHNILGFPLYLTLIQIILIDLCTDIWTGVSYAYQKKETDLMKKKPRNLKKQKMVSISMIIYSYLHIGVLQTLGCFLTFSKILYNHGKGIDFSSFININRNEWNNYGNKHMYCYYPNENASRFVKYECQFNEYAGVGVHHDISIEEQKKLLMQAQTGAYITLVLFQMTAAIITQTRTTNLLFTKNENVKIFGNKWLNICLLFELLFTIFIVYNPITNDWLEMEIIPFNAWFYSMPFIILCFIIEEIRKYVGSTTKNKQIKNLLIW